MSDGFYPTEPFAESRGRFDKIVKRLESPDARKMDHGDLENSLLCDGRELIRQLLQDHLELRHSREPRLPGVEGADGVLRTHVRERQRDLVSIFGLVVVDRFAYSAPETEQLCPADAQLNLPPERHSQGIALRMSEEAARGSFEEPPAGSGTGVAVQAPSRAAGLAFGIGLRGVLSRAALGPEPTQTCW
jgi:hypothetical protein